MIWRKRNEGLLQGCVAKGRKCGTGGKLVHLMVAISYNKGVIMCEQYEKLNGAYFVSFIERNFENMFIDSGKAPSRLWLQDGDPSQNCVMARNAMQHVNADLLNIPARSPDLNPIENLFHLVGKKLKQDAIDQNIEIESFKEFSKRVIDTITNTDSGVIDNIIESMPKRIKDVIKVRGERLKY